MHHSYIKLPQPKKADFTKITVYIIARYIINSNVITPTLFTEEFLCRIIPCHSLPLHHSTMVELSSLDDTPFIAQKLPFRHLRFQKPFPISHRPFFITSITGLPSRSHVLTELNHLSKIPRCFVILHCSWNFQIIQYSILYGYLHIQTLEAQLGIFIIENGIEFNRIYDKK